MPSILASYAFADIADSKTKIKINNLCFMIVVLVIFDITTAKIRKKAESAKL